LKDAPIVLLDEATASLDPENELYIQEAIDGLVQEKTVVVIAHRLNTVVQADKIVVLQDGAIVGQGTHDELMCAEGLYRRMWDEQQKVRQWRFGEDLTPAITTARQPLPSGLGLSLTEAVGKNAKSTALKGDLLKRKRPGL
jgi:ATP-binding cassette subfamily B protein